MEGGREGGREGGWKDCVCVCACTICVVFCSLDLATLRQLRRAVLVEMTVRQQHIDNRNEIIRASEARVGPRMYLIHYYHASITILCILPFCATYWVHGSLRCPVFSGSTSQWCSWGHWVVLTVQLLIAVCGPVH